MESIQSHPCVDLEKLRTEVDALRERFAAVERIVDEHSLQIGHLSVAFSELARDVRNMGAQVGRLTDVATRHSLSLERIDRNTVKVLLLLERKGD